MIERAVILSETESLELGPWFRTASVASAQPKPQELDDVQRRHILEVLEQTGWRVSGKGGAAERLGLKRTALEHRIKKLGIHRDDR